MFSQFQVRKNLNFSDRTIRNSGKRERKRMGKRREREGEKISIKNEGNINARKSKSAEAKD